MPVASAPSPKFQWYLTIGGLFAVEEEPSKDTGSGALPAAVVEDNTAVGGTGVVVLSRAVIVVVATLVIPFSSVTVKVALYEPGKE